MKNRIKSTFIFTCVLLFSISQVLYASDEFGSDSFENLEMSDMFEENFGSTFEDEENGELPSVTCPDFEIGNGSNDTVSKDMDLQVGEDMPDFNNSDDSGMDINTDNINTSPSIQDDNNNPSIPESDIFSFESLGDMNIHMETPELEMPDLDAARIEITESMRLNAESTLKDLMGDSFISLDSDLFNTGALPNIDMESLNIQYAEMVEDFQNNGLGLSVAIGDSETLQFDGFSGSVSDVFDEMFADVKVPERKTLEIPSDFNPSSVIAQNMAERNKTLSVFKKSDVYKTVQNKMSISSKVSDSKNKAVHRKVNSLKKQISS